MLSDLNYIIWWWLVLFLLGALSLPLIVSIFRNFWDKGYIFTKIVSSALLTYLIFILGVPHFLPFTQNSILLLILFAAFLIYRYLSQNGSANLKIFKKILSQNWKIFLFEEILFLVILTTWSFVRGFAPEIEGLEKYMDWGFVNSALRSKFMPPADMWFAGQPINYYYFGHLLFAVLTKLSTIPSSITYNLSIATICALTFTSGFSIASNLSYFYLKNIKPKIINTRPGLFILAGLISAFLLTFGGNLHAVYKITRNNIEANEGKFTLTQSALQSAVSSYWYPDATRFIGFDPETDDKTIHEFPIYSFTVADLHGHLNDVPVILFLVALLLAFTTTKYVKTPTDQPLNWKLIFGLGLTLAIAYMTNAWDFAVYGLLFAVVYLFYNLKYSANLPYSLFKTASNGFMIIIFWYLFTLPFSLNFTPMAEGLRFSDSHTPFYQLFILYGGFWLICLPFVLFLFFRKIKTKSHQFPFTDIFTLALILVATFLIIIPEIGYIKDIYIFEHRRANTMFKLVYQAFIMYSLVSGYIWLRLIGSLKTPLYRRTYKLLFIIVFLSHLIYPYFAVKSYYGLTQSKGLDGLKYLLNRYSDNYAAINWINQNIPDQPVIVEAVGDSYTEYNQISVGTGLPTVEGWVVHEWLWRGGYDQPSIRQSDVQQIYESTDVNEVRSLLQKYSVSYIFVGDLEREKYPNHTQEVFNKIAKIIFQSNDTRLYKITK